MSDVRHAFESVYRTHRESLVWRLFRMVSCRATAEDLAQDAYVRVASVLDRQPIKNLSSFLFQTANNLAIDHMRRERRNDRLTPGVGDENTIGEIPSPDISPEGMAAQREAVGRLTTALAGLPDRTQQVLILNRLDGLSYPEIADRLGVSQSTVYKDMQVALNHCLAAVAER